MEFYKLLVILTAVLKVVLSVPTGQYFTTEPEDAIATSGHHLRLKCEIANRKGACQWTKDGFGLGVDPDLPGFPRFNMEDCNLDIYPVLPEDEGSYQCQVGAIPGVPAVTSDVAKVTVVAPPGVPYIRQAQEADIFEVMEGEEIVLDCETNGAKPPAEVIWKDERGKVIMSNLIETVTKDKKTKTFKTVSTLRFKAKEKISLTCSAFNEAFTEPRESRKLEIQPKYKPKLRLEFPESAVKEGTTLALKCSANAYPKEVTFKWFINDKEIEEESETLTLENVSKELNGALVKCDAENSIGVSQVSTILNIEYVPKILKQPTSVIAKHGERVTFTCLAEGNPEPNYIWVKGDKQELIGVSQKLTLEAGDDTEDEYICKVFVEGHDVLVSKPATLKIKRKPEVTVDDVRYATLGDDVILQCQVKSLSKDTSLVWVKDNVPMKSDKTKHRIIESDQGYDFASDLIIYGIKKEDFGNYGCFAANDVGSDQKMLPLIEEEESNYLTTILTVNTVVGAVILFFVIVYHKFKKKSRGRSELPELEKEAPICKDPTVFDELILDNGMHEEYGSISKEYFDNIQNTERSRDLRII